MGKPLFSSFQQRVSRQGQQLLSRWNGLSDHSQVGVCLAGVTGVLAFWALFWPVPTEVKGHGVLIYPNNAGLLNSRAEGQVRQVHVQVGDQVQEGQLLMERYLPVLERQLAQQQGNLAQLEEINNDLNLRDQLRLETEQLALDVALAKFNDDQQRYSRLQNTYASKINNLEWLSQHLHLFLQAQHVLCASKSNSKISAQKNIKQTSRSSV